MEQKQQEAAATTATTPKALHKDSDNLQTIKELNPKFDNITATDIKKHVEEMAKNENVGLFIVQPANKWIKQAESRPIPKMLFSEFWYEGEVCILFSDTNLGKTILAVQIAVSITQGEPIKGFKLEAENQPVLYFDFELTDKQFQNRYSLNYEQPYKFNDSLLRVEINPNSEIPESQTFENFLNQSIENAILKTGARVLIIDNLTYLSAETEKAKDALPLMKRLKALKNKYNLSLLILAHTPKRDLTKAITRNDLQGSKMLINFCDSSFSMGESYTDKSLRYIKMIKARNTEIIYDSENVCVCQICKPFNFLHFEFLHFGTESQHLKQYTEREKTEIENEVKLLLETEPKITAYAIAKKLCKDESKFKSFHVKVTRIITKISNK